MIQISFDTDLDKSKVKKLLNGIPADANRVMKVSLNATLRTAWSMVSEEAMKTYEAKNDVFKKGKGKFADIKLKGATNKNMTAQILLRGKKLDLYSFKTNPTDYDPRNRPDVSTGKVLKASQMKKIYKDGFKGFLIQTKSGHVTMVARKGEGRKVRTLYAPAVPQMIGGERIYGQLAPHIGDILQKEVQTRVEKEIKKYAKK